LTSDLAASSAGVSDRIPHLRGRSSELEALGWTGRAAEWVALVCLHSGAFIRAQYLAFLGTDERKPAERVVASLLAGDEPAATEETWGDLGLGKAPGDRPRLLVCRVVSRKVYRALGVEHIRHRREASPAVQLRRLLSLDYVVDHADEPWLPTEDEKVGAFEGLEIPGDVLPRRDYRGEGGTRRRHFVGKFPIALAGDAATFVYVDAGDATAKGLGSWGKDHRVLWTALRQRGIAVGVVVVSRSHGSLARAERVLSRWKRGTGGEAVEAVAERKQLEEAIAEVDVEALAKYGGVDGALARLSELEAMPPAEAGGGWIDTGTTWHSRRLAGR